MARVKKVKEIQELMWKPERIRNIGIVAHVDHGKTTLTDSLVAAAGIISMELAGEQLFTDYWELEQQRGITINAVAVSLVHDYEGEEYLINLIDTPGHVDFSGDVTRALRAIDGVVMVVDAVEGVMVQTETNLRMALKERTKPILFINKVDRLIQELRISPEEMQHRFFQIITKFNQLIKKYAPEEFKKEWQVRVEDGSVAFGSALHKWALSIPQMKKKGITFKDIIEAYKEDNWKVLSEKSPLYEVILDMVIRHLPNPKVAQKVRVPILWPGNINDGVGKDMLECNPEGKVVMVITDVLVDEHAGVVSTGRIFSGVLERGREIHLVNAKKDYKVQQVAIYIGPERVQVEKVPAGNIAAIIGSKEARVGETITDKGLDIPPFEEITYLSEPVVTVAIEPEDVSDLPKLIDTLNKISIEDPNIQVKINQETGEYLVSGMGELHLEITEYKLKEAGLKVRTSEPLVVYRETITGNAGPIEGKSPNKHNKFYIVVEPLEEEVQRAIEEKRVTSTQDRKERAKILRELGWPTDHAKGVMWIEGVNVLVDATKGVQYMRETKELIIEAFKQAMNEGPIAREPVRGVKVILVDAVLHEDAVHRGPAQIYPAVRRPIYAGILSANPRLMEPILRLEVRVPEEFLGGVTKVIQTRRGQLLTMEHEEDVMVVKALIPVAESFGLAAELRSETEGRAIWGTQFEKFELVPRELEPEIVRRVRERKGLKPEPPSPEEYMSR
ncbi:elongation factor EF-2 [Thermococci archaeon]|nr:MAG: elongation factor EF-2 [Thermococci archaeon]